MNKKIKEVFDGIHAENELKTNTKVFIANKLSQKETHRTFRAARFVSAALCVLFAVTGGGTWLYFTPTAAVSIDVNPSLELDVNCFDKVLSVKGYNDSGEEISSSVNVKFMDCNKAVEQILESETVSSELSDDGLLTVTVSGNNEKQCRKLLNKLEDCTKEHKNAQCYASTKEQAQTAHEHGLSHGKYMVFLELKALDETITEEDVQNMTMREMRDLINTLSGNTETNGCQGNGNGQGNGKHHNH